MFGGDLLRKCLKLVCQKGTKLMTIGFRYGWLALVAMFGLIGCNSPPQVGSHTYRGELSSETPHSAASIKAGREVFGVGGCVSCHSVPDAPVVVPPRLGGGLKLTTQFGAFFVPNISSDPIKGIGSWTIAEFTNAMKNGMSPTGEHYYPTFPYPSYARMTDGDIRDLWAYMQTLPSVDNDVLPHKMQFPFASRNMVGLWKQFYFKPQKVIPTTQSSDEIRRGQYLVEGPGHCAECHTPRGVLGGFKYSRWLAGGKAPDGESIVPNITPHETGLGEWSKDEIVESLAADLTHSETGFEGFGMDAVRRNLAVLPLQDRKDIAAYLMAIRPVATN